MKLIGFDSLGTRSMATVVEVNGVKIFIDPGVSYAPKRYGLPPHPIELEFFEKHLDEIHDEIQDSSYIVISHYHRDHYLYRAGEEVYYKGKVLFVKNPTKDINASQKIRAYRLLKKMGVEEIAKEVRIADSQRYFLDNGVVLEFSSPVPHGQTGTRLGYVVMTYIKSDDISILHASDVQGPMNLLAKKFIKEKDPNILVISGPPTYMEGNMVEDKDIREALNNICEIITSTKNLNTIIYDHHLLRDLNYRKKIEDVIKLARENNVKLITAAEYLGKPVRQLEALRRKLWGKDHS